MTIPGRFKIGIGAGILLIFLVALNFNPFSKEVKNFFYLMSSPLQKWLWKAGDSASDFFEAIKETKNLKKENEELILKIQFLEAENAALKEVKKENEVLRKALDIGLEKEFKFEIAQVIGKETDKDFIFINKGSDEGISKNFPVITSEKVLIGRIQEVYNNFSKVIILTAKDSSFDAKIAGTDIYGVAKGEGNSGLLLDLIPKEKEIKEGDLVITSALGGVFPQGLFVGKITNFEKTDVKSWQVAQIQPSFDLNEIENLLVITGSQ